MDKRNHNNKPYHRSVPPLAELLPADNDSLKILDERAKVLASCEEDRDSSRGHQIDYVKFILGDDEYYGLPYVDILDVRPNAHLTRVPKCPDYFLGVCYWHGKIISVIDLGRYFGIRRDDCCMAAPYIATIAHSNGVIGLAFDYVVGVDSFEENNLDEALSAHTKILKSYLHGIHNGKTAILNIHAILTDIMADRQSARGSHHE